MTVDAVAEVRATRHAEGHVRVGQGEVERAVAVAVRKALEAWGDGNAGAPDEVRVSLKVVMVPY